MITLSAENGTPCRSYEATGGANEVIEIQIDRRIRKVAIRPVTNDGLLSLLQTLGDGDLISADPDPAVPLDADTWNEFHVGRDASAGVAGEPVRRIFVTSATPGTGFHVWGSLE